MKYWRVLKKEEFRNDYKGDKMDRNYSNYIKFWPEFKQELSEEALEEALYFIYYDKEVLVQNSGDTIQMPTKEVVEALSTGLKNSYYLGELEGKACICGKIEEAQGIQEDFSFIPLNDPIWEVDEQLYFVAIKAMQLMGWDENTKYCGRCGSAYERKEDERAKICPHCGKIEYPRISPAIIVGITRGDDILLAHNAHFKEGLYSIIAGFVEQGETLEQAVKREVYEEVGIKVKNITYVSSKPWSASDSIMLGFTAEYESGEIQVDGKEIIDAGWYNKTHLPPLLPMPITTAREIINKLLDIDNTVMGSVKY